MHGGIHALGCLRREGGMCVAEGGMHGKRGGACLVGEAATAAGGTHPTGMHSCIELNSSNWTRIMKKIE